VSASDDTNPPVPPNENVETFVDDHDEEWELAMERKFRTAKRKWNGREPETSELNLTAMMDMLTILLVYLLKSYNTNPAASLHPGVAPPSSSSRLEIKESLSISVSSDMIMVENKQVMQLVNSEVRAEDAQGAGTAKLITPLFDALDAEVTKIKTLHERGYGPEFEGKALIVADRKVPYSLLSSVLYTSGQAQFSQFQFVILKQ
jgi:biopolymer transport protein ExbD